MFTVHIQCGHLTLSVALSISCSVLMLMLCSECSRRACELCRDSLTIWMLTNETVANVVIAATSHQAPTAINCTIHLLSLDKYTENFNLNFASLCASYRTDFFYSFFQKYRVCMCLVVWLCENAYMLLYEWYIDLCMWVSECVCAIANVSRLI